MRFDITVIGGGIVGLASAWTLINRHPGIRLALLEKENQLATHQTDRNSGVIHSGIYYKPGCAKAVNCIRGYGMLIDFCQQNNIPFELCGKIIIAVKDEELPGLNGIFERGLMNGLSGIRMIDQKEAMEIEPFCNAIKGIWVPQAGIIDYRTVANQLKELIQRKGGQIITDCKVNKIIETKDGLVIKSNQSDIESSFAIGCAGLYSDHLAKMAGLNPPHQIVPFRGEFYQLAPEALKLVRGLIYPVPDINFPFLGVHLTKRIGGGVEAGPNAVLAFRREGYDHLDVHWGELIESLRYKGFHRMARRHWRKGMDEMVRSFSKRAFLQSIQQLVPQLKSSDIQRSRTGVRAQALDKDGNMVDDYAVMHQDKMIHLLNSPSPAATSCLSIGDYIARLYEERIKKG